MDRCSRIPRRLTSGLEPPIHFPVSHFPVRISANRIIEDREIPAHYSLLSHCAELRFLIVVGVCHTLHSPHRRRLSAWRLQNSIDMPILRRSEFKQSHGTWLARRQSEEERLRVWQPAWRLPHQRFSKIGVPYIPVLHSPVGKIRHRNWHGKM